MEDEIASAAVKFTCLCLIVWVLFVCLNMLNKQEKSTTIENIPLSTTIENIHFIVWFLPMNMNTKDISF